MLISDVLTMFESVSGLIYKLKNEKNLLLNGDVLAVLLTAWGKIVIFQTYVMARNINNINASWQFARLPASSKTRLPKQGH